LIHFITALDPAALKLEYLFIFWWYSKAPNFKTNRTKSFPILLHYKLQTLWHINDGVKVHQYHQDSTLSSRRLWLGQWVRVCFLFCFSC
jgi:hypothetical protein